MVERKVFYPGNLALARESRQKRYGRAIDSLANKFDIPLEDATVTEIKLLILHPDADPESFRVLPPTVTTPVRNYIQELRTQIKKNEIKPHTSTLLELIAIGETHP